MRRTAAGTLGALAILAALTVPAAAASQAVRVGSYYFEDGSSGDGQVVIDQGDRITFTFEGTTTHTATVDGLFDSGVRNPGTTYTTSALTPAGTYTLYCQVHGTARHSTKLVIQPTAAPSPTAARPSPSRSRTPAPTKTAAPQPSRSASPAASPRVTAAPASTAAPSPSPSASRSSAATTAPSPSSPPASEAAASAEPSPIDVPPLTAAAPDQHRDLLLPALLVLLFLLAALALTAAAIRRRRL